MDAAPIVVGIDRSPESDQALDWAAAEARRRLAPLMIVHASDLVDPTADGNVIETDAQGRVLMDDAGVFVAEHYPDVAVTKRVGRANAADLLIDLARTAQLVVVGTAADSRLVDALLGSVSRRVAAQASCPVVVVGPSTRTAEVTRQIVAGVSPSVGGYAALRFAAQEAISRGARLIAVRGYGVFGRSEHGVIFGPLPNLVHDETRILEDAVTMLRIEFPDLPVEPSLVDEPATDALPAAARRADLLVVGCHYRDDRWPSRLGAITSSILHRSPCPVVVVGVDDRSAQRRWVATT